MEKNNSYSKKRWEWGAIAGKRIKNRFYIKYNKNKKLLRKTKTTCI